MTGSSPPELEHMTKLVRNKYLKEAVAGGSCMLPFIRS